MIYFHKHLMIKAMITKDFHNDMDDTSILNNLLKLDVPVSGPFDLPDGEFVPCDLKCTSYYVANYDLVHKDTI